MRGDPIVISTVGQLDSITEHETPYVHIGFAFQDKTYVRTLHLPLAPRRIQKAIIMNTVFSEILTTLTGQTRVPADHTYSAIQDQQYTASDENLKSTLAYLKHHHLTLATVESCTGGAIANKITDIHGASAIFDRAWVLYDENAKTMLGVPLLTRAQGGVYSEIVAFQMALAGYQKSRADVVIATTGVMDTIDTRPFHNGTPPGTVYIAILVKNMRPLTYQLTVPIQSRQQMKQEIVSSVMFKLKEMLLVQELQSVSASSI